MDFRAEGKITPVIPQEQSHGGARVRSAQIVVIISAPDVIEAAMVAQDFLRSMGSGRIGQIEEI
jgi:hypothetical protein